MQNKLGGFGVLQKEAPQTLFVFQYGISESDE